MFEYLLKLRHFFHFLFTERRGLTILFVVFLSFSANAQRDVIVTQAGEEIRCRILDETPTRFIYAYVGTKGKILRNEIFKNLVKDFKYNKYDSDLVQHSAQDKKEDQKFREKNNEPSVKQESIASQNNTTKAGSTASANKPSGQNTAASSVQKPTQQTSVPAAGKAPVISGEGKSVVSSNTATRTATQKPQEAEILIPKETQTVLPKTTTVPQTPAPVVKSSELLHSRMLKWRVGLKAGIGNIKNNGFNAVNEYDLYREKLMKGFVFGADVAYFPTEILGFGVVYTDFRSRNSSENLTYSHPITDTEIRGGISNAISRKFVGPALFLRKSLDYKTFLVLGASPGMYFYSDKGDHNGTDFKYKGNQFGGAATLGIDFLIGNDIAGRDIILSLEAGYNHGRLKKLDYGDGPVLLNNPIVMDRLDFSIGLRFMRFPRYLRNSY
jgi:hypothetical protein